MDGRRQPREKRNRRLAACLLLATLLVAGCGGDDNDDAAPASTTPASPGPAAAGKAQSAVLQSADFPPGWEALPPGEGGLHLEETWTDLTRCLGVENRGQPAGVATSPTYLRDLATQARSTVEYLPEPAAQAIATSLAGSKFQACATEAFNADAKRSAPEDAVPGPVEVSPLDSPTYSQATSASRIRVTMNLSDLQVPIFQDFLVFVDGGTVTRMFFLNPGAPFPPDLERSLVEKVLARD